MDRTEVDKSILDEFRHHPVPATYSEKKPPLEGAETVEHFLARGGVTYQAFQGESNVNPLASLRGTSFLYIKNRNNR